MTANALLILPNKERNFCLILHYNESNRYIFVYGVKIYQFKGKDSELNGYPLCLGNISRDFAVDKIREAGINAYSYGFSVDYYSIDVDNILNIHKYLMKKKKDIKQCFNLLKKCLLDY